MGRRGRGVREEESGENVMRWMRERSGRRGKGGERI